jgi:uncharacterized SAM-binding protein YcdF (DUF218 family)
VSAVRRHPVLFTIAVVSIAVVVLLAVTALAVWRAAHSDDASRINTVDAILVLGAAHYNGDPSPVFEGRLRHAALLYRDGRSDRVLVLGGTAPGDEISEAEAGRDWLLAEGLPAAAVDASAVGATSLESLRAAAKWMRDRGLESAFLVSDPWHNLRIEKMASDLGIVAYVSATWQSAASSEWTRLAGYARETFAYLYYRLLDP